MKKTLKLIALALAAVTLLATVACSGSGTTTATATPAATTGNTATPDAAATPAATEPVAENREPVTVRYWYPMHVNDIAEDYVDAPGDLLLAEITGVTIQWENVPAQNVDESYNLMMASGNLPDIVVRGPLELKRYVDAWLPLDSYVVGNSRYANLDKYIYQDNYLKAYLPDSDGQNRIIPMLATRTIGDMIMVREDLLAAYNLPNDLVTTDDWYNALTIAKEDGKIPYMTRQKRAGILYRLLGGFSDCMQEEYYVDADQKTVKYGVLEPRFKEVIELARQWYSEGLIDPEYPTTDATKWWEQMLAGNVFASHDNIMRLSSANKDFIQNQSVDYRFMGMGPIESPVTGTRNTTIHYPRVRDKSAALSANTQYAERILDMFEYIFSEDGFYLINWGIEGYSYEMVDGYPVAIQDYVTKSETREIKKVGADRDGPGNQADELVFNYNQGYDYDAALVAARDLYNANPFIRQNWIESISFTDEERSSMQALETELDTYRGEMLDKFIMGTEPMENWDKFVQAMIAMGVEDNISIYQTALDRVQANLQ